MYPPEIVVSLGTVTVAIQNHTAPEPAKPVPPQES